MKKHQRMLLYKDKTKECSCRTSSNRSLPFLKPASKDTRRKKPSPLDRPADRPADASHDKDEGMHIRLFPPTTSLALTQFLEILAHRYGTRKNQQQCPYQHSHVQYSTAILPQNNNQPSSSRQSVCICRMDLTSFRRIIKKSSAGFGGH